jgi:transglycosylase-like protein with SLT domain
MQTTAIKRLVSIAFYSLPLIAFAAHGTGPIAKEVTTESTQSSSLPVKVTIYKSRQAHVASLFSAMANPPQLPGGKPSAQEVKAYVQTQAMEFGVSPKLALWIVKHESHFDPHAKGDGEASRGLWQISRIYHPEVSDAVAFNVASSTEWSLERIRSGKVNEWSTYRFCRTLYEDCPF